jgi:3-phenylpropionate/cinnamic acid dioxygenase small subunit
MRNDLQSLLDRAAIQDVLLRYARGVDRRDLALVASCFTADAAYDGTLARGLIGDALAQLPRAFARYESSTHFVGNQLITLDGDQASSETYTIAYHRLTGAPRRDRTVAVRYEDDLVRTTDGWRIRRRVVRLDWERTDVVEPSP